MQLFEESHFVRANLVEASILNIVHAGCESGNAQDIWRATLQKVRQLAGLCFAGGITSGTPLAPGP